MSLSERIITYKRNKIEDHRGWFLKVINGKETDLPKHTGEIYLTLAKPGEMKGGHYHPIANEWFTLIQGTCVLKLADVETKEYLEIELDSQEPVTVYVPCGIAHGFFNTCPKQDFILIAYSDELFDPSDTIPFNFI
ncbi:MAG TPA: WxcM-like domain-containing protein [Lutibacter sp.]